MGFFTTEKKEPVAPNRTQRAACWAGRDKFFGCLDKNNIINSVGEKAAKRATELCGKEEKEFEKNCAASWVEYFKKQRVMLHKREQMIKGLEKENAQRVELPGAGNGP